MWPPLPKGSNKTPSLTTPINRAFRIWQEHGASMSRDLNNLIQSAPPQVRQDLAAHMMENLAASDPAKCLEALDKYFPTDSKVWERVFLGRFGDGRYTLNAAQMN